MISEQQVDGYLITTDKAKINTDYVHDFLSNRSYWAAGIPLSHVKKSIDNSIAISVMHNGNQIGFARIITDQITFAYLADVFIDEAYRGKGLSKKLMDFIMKLDEVQSFRRFILGTRDAHSLYTKYGFQTITYPERFMEARQPDIYKKQTT